MRVQGVWPCVWDHVWICERWQLGKTIGCLGMWEQTLFIRPFSLSDSKGNALFSWKTYLTWGKRLLNPLLTTLVGDSSYSIKVETIELSLPVHGNKLRCCKHQSKAWLWIQIPEDDIKTPYMKTPPLLVCQLCVCVCFS